MTISTVTTERLKQIASGNAFTCTQDDESALMAAELLAVREAQPVASTTKSNIDAVLGGVSTVIWPVRCFKGGASVDLYTAPPALPANVIGRPATPDDSPYPATISGGCLLAQAWADGYNVRNAVTAPPAPAVPGWEHISNEWADVATSALVWLKNIADGISTPEVAIKNTELGIAVCRAAMLQSCDAVRDLSTPVDPQIAEYEQALDMVGMSVSVDVSTSDDNAGYRYFGRVTEVQQSANPKDKCGVVLLVQDDVESNFDDGIAPDGYKLMPIEMTDQIGEAIAMEANCCGGIALDIYNAALAAAPTPAK